jgi:hypothetical protein
MSLSNIYKILPTLTALELTQIKNRIDFLLLNQTSLESDPEEMLFYNIITKELERKIALEPMYFGVFKTKQTYKKFKQTFTFIKKYSKTVLRDNYNKKTRVRFYILFVQIIMNYINKYELPKDLKTVLNCHEKFPSQLDQMFPGYLEAGLFSIIFD